MGKICTPREGTRGSATACQACPPMLSRGLLVPMFHGVIFSLFLGLVSCCGTSGQQETSMDGAWSDGAWSETSRRWSAIFQHLRHLDRTGRADGLVVFRGRSPARRRPHVERAGFFVETRCHVPDGSRHTSCVGARRIGRSSSSGSLAEPGRARLAGGSGVGSTGAGAGSTGAGIA